MTKKGVRRRIKEKVADESNFAIEAYPFPKRARKGAIDDDVLSGIIEHMGATVVPRRRARRSRKAESE